MIITRISPLTWRMIWRIPRPTARSSDRRAAGQGKHLLRRAIFWSRIRSR